MWNVHTKLSISILGTNTAMDTVTEQQMPNINYEEHGNLYSGACFKCDTAPFERKCRKKCLFVPSLGKHRGRKHIRNSFD